jgi:hypothetical protein
MAARDEVVAQRPEDIRLLISVFHSPTSCAGAATAFLLRRIAYRAGAYAPGIQEHMFHELNTTRDGRTIDSVQRWFNSHVSSLHELGYRLQCRRVATPTPAIVDWVSAGRGYRGAMLPTNFQKLHPTPGDGGKDSADDAVAHAVGLTIDRIDASTDEELVQIDPWPGVKGGGKERGKPSPALEAAHKDRNYHGLIFFWTGWS